MKKSYNPFKMFGSYLGGVIFLLILFLQTGKVEAFVLKLMWPFSAILCEAVKVGFLDKPDILETFLCNPLILIPVFIYGFLIGWGIHSLIRSLRK